MENIMEEGKCPICGQHCYIHSRAGSNVPTYKCDFCFAYELAEEDIPLAQKHKVILAGYLFETRSRSHSIRINSGTLPIILSDSRIPKTPLQKLDKLVLSIYDLGSGFKNHISKLAKYPPAVCYAEDAAEFNLMVSTLNDIGYLRERQARFGEYDCGYFITVEGMRYAESLLSGNTRSTTVFVAVQGSDELRSVYEKGVRAACAEFGLSVSIIDTPENKENSADKVIVGIKTSRFVIADFTNNTLGVYYEAGYAKGLGREVIKTCSKAWFEKEKDGKRVNRLHFDIEYDNLILWQDENDLKRKLEDRIQAAIL